MITAFFFVILCPSKIKIMCGIVGYIGPREAYPIIITGLKRQEYRGYDSTGVALINEKGLHIFKPFSFMSATPVLS